MKSSFFLLDYVLQKFEYKNQVHFFNHEDTILIGQRINGKDVEVLLPNKNDLRLAYNTKAGYICTPGRLGF